MAELVNLLLTRFMFVHLFSIRTLLSLSLWVMYRYNCIVLVFLHKNIHFQRSYECWLVGYDASLPDWLTDWTDCCLGQWSEEYLINIILNRWPRSDSRILQEMCGVGVEYIWNIVETTANYIWNNSNEFV